MIFRHACLLILFYGIEMLAAALVRAFWQPASSLILWPGSRIHHKRRVYGLPRATYVAMFMAIFCNTRVWAIRVHFCSYLHDYTGYGLQICWNNSSKVVVGNGGLNSNFFLRIMHGFLVDGHIYIYA